ncbi:Pch2 protein [Martiniozyma asiatica (nom. inval.)]|nr:Pch2 protein [Martiniozyma asiatica]
MIISNWINAQLKIRQDEAILEWATATGTNHTTTGNTWKIVEKIIEDIETLSHLQINDNNSNIDHLWALYQVVAHTNSGNFSNDIPLLKQIICFFIKDIIVVDKEIIADKSISANININGKSTGDDFFLMNNLDGILNELESLNNKNSHEDDSNDELKGEVERKLEREKIQRERIGVIGRWVKMEANNKRQNIGNLCISLKFSYIFKESYAKLFLSNDQNLKDLNNDNNYANENEDDDEDDDDNDDENEICQLVRQASLNEISLSTISKASIKSINLPNFEYFKLSKKLQYDNDVNFTIFNDLKTISKSCELILLHGPPGSGKTSLGKCISNSLFINSKFKKGLLLEVSCARLLSKYMNQSDKNIDILFKDFEIIASKNLDSKLYILIDEVETLVRDRNYLLNSSSPNAAMQIVNTILICLDRILIHPNVMIITTSNLLKNIDNAFIDRIGYIYHIDRPSQRAIEKMLNYHFQNICDENIYSKIAQILFKLSFSGRYIEKLIIQCKRNEELPTTGQLEQFLIKSLSRCRDVF